MTPHLSETELHDLLSSSSSSARERHLDGCANCREELATLDQSIANFRLAATNFALLHTPPRPAVAVPVKRGFLALPRLMWATGLASVLAVAAVTLSTVHKPVVANTPHTAVAAASPQPVSDEALLRDIDSDLSTSVPPSLQPLDSPAAASEPTTTSTSN